MMEVLGNGGRGETIGTRTLSQRPTLPLSKQGQQGQSATWMMWRGKKRFVKDKGGKDGDELVVSWMDIHSMI